MILVPSPIWVMYYRKRNVNRFRRHCQECGRETEHLSFEGSKFLVFCLVPVLPLGRKQVLDYCVLCTTHREMSIVDWERLQHQSLRTQSAVVEQSPNDPAAAIELL